MGLTLVLAIRKGGGGFKKFPPFKGGGGGRMKGFEVVLTWV